MLRPLRRRLELLLLLPQVLRKNALPPRPCAQHAGLLLFSQPIELRAWWPPHLLLLGRRRLLPASLLLPLRRHVYLLMRRGIAEAARRSAAGQPLAGVVLKPAAAWSKPAG